MIQNHIIFSMIPQCYISLIPLTKAPGSDSMTIKPWPLFKNLCLDYCHKEDFDWLNFTFPTMWWGLKRTLSKLPQGRQGLNRLMIVTQVYNPLAFACYQMGRPQSIFMRIYLDILKCTHYLLFTCISDNFWACIFLHANSRKPGICISYSSKRRSALYWLHNDSLYAKDFYCSIYLFVW